MRGDTTTAPTAHARSAETPEHPAAAIEAAVLATAHRIALDLDAPGGHEQLRDLIRTHLGEWDDEYRRGRRRHALADPSGVARRVFNNIAAYGPLTDLLADPDVWEIMVNAPDQVFTRRHRGPSGHHPEAFTDDDHVIRTLTKLLEDASGSHRKLDLTEGLQDAQLDDGSRVHIVHGDIARGGHTVVNIRRFTGIRYERLTDLVDNGTLSAGAARFLAACVAARRNIVIAGAPGSGKTTLLSCLAAELDPTLRVVVAEEVFETDIPVANVAQLQTRPARADRAPVDLRRLVSAFLRMAPDVAIVGEVRDREALALLLTLSSGVTGFTTLHAGSARQALSRLRFVCQLADVGSELPMSALNSLVSDCIDVVVHCERTPQGPRVDEILAVEDPTGGLDAARFTATEVFDTDTATATLRWTGQVPGRLERHLRRSGQDAVGLLEGR